MIKDPSNPDTEGKVYLYKFGKKIFNKISERLEPEFVDEEAFNPFDLWEGANFRLKIKMVEGYRNYDSSSFDKPEALFDNDDKLEKVWKDEYSLKEFIDPSNFKTYDELKEKLDKVLSESLPISNVKSVLEDDNPFSFPSKGKTLESRTIPSLTDLDEDPEDDMARFQKLVG